MKKKITIIVLMLIMMMGITGCVIKRDSLEGVDIYTTVYPIEYVVDALYGYNSNVLSIYPAEVDLSEYKLTNKQIDNYSKWAVFVYNGLTSEKSIARDLLNKNIGLKIIDVSQGLEYTYAVEELWLNPRDYLMVAHNIKNGLEEYISNKYIIDEIEKNYESLKVLISSFDAELELIPDSAKDDNLIVASDALSFLSKYGFTVTNVDEKTGEIPSATLSKAKRLIQSGTVKYIFMLDSEEETDTVEELVTAGASVIKLRSMTIKTEEDLKTGITYKNMMRETIDAIKKEVYE